MSSSPRQSFFFFLVAVLVTHSCNGAFTRFLSDKAAGSGFTLTTSPADGATIGSLAQIDVTFSKPPTGATTLSNYALSGAGAAGLSITGVSLLSGMTYRLAISGAVANGTITLTLSGITDAEGNTPSPGSVTFTGNITNPTFTASPAAAGSINSLTSFTLTYSSSVNGAATAANYTITNAAGGTLAVSSVTGSGAGPYTVNLTGVVGNGTISIAIAGVTDSATGLALAGSPLTYTADTTAPTVTISTTATNPTNVSPFTVTFTFSENVTGFALGDITVGNGSAGNFQTTSASVYTADITPSGVASVTIDVAGSVAQDTAGNNNTAATQLARNYDNVQPTVTISSTAPTSTNTSPIPVTITFSKSVTGFVVGDITVGNGTAGNFAGSGTTYTADITPTAQGAVTVDVAAGVAADAAGNTNTVATQLSRTYDSVAPTMTPSPAQNSAVGTVFTTLDVTYNETVVNAGTTGNYVFSGSGANTLAVSSITQNGGGCGTNCYRIALTGTPTNGSIVITISNVQDSAGNALSGTTINYVGGWTKRRKITIDNSAQAQNLTNFPLVVRVDSSRIDYANTQNSGEDIRFYDADGTTLLSHEIEKWNESGSSYVWVKVPQIDASSNTDYIWMYYGNPTVADGQSATNVWDANYKSVLHLKSGSFSDSTANANNGTNSGTTDATGQIGDAKLFDGSSTYITATASGLSASQGTFSAWAYPTLSLAAGAQAYIISHRSAFASSCLNNDRIYLHMRNNNPPASALATGIGNLPPSTTTSGTLTMNAWNFVVLTWNAGNYKVYLNGVDVTIGGTYTNFATLDSFFTIGRYHCAGEVWGGMIDEVRASSTARPAAWIAAEYKSMNDTFVTFGPEL